MAEKFKLGLIGAMALLSGSLLGSDAVAAAPGSMTSGATKRQPLSFDEILEPSMDRDHTLDLDRDQTFDFSRDQPVTANGGKAQKAPAQNAQAKGVVGKGAAAKGAHAKAAPAKAKGKAKPLAKAKAKPNKPKAKPGKRVRYRETAKG